jgi:hypothetical protein
MKTMHQIVRVGRWLQPGTEQRQWFQGMHCLGLVDFRVLEGDLAIDQRYGR